MNRNGGRTKAAGGGWKRRLGGWLVALLLLAGGTRAARADCVTNESSLIDLSSWSVVQYEFDSQPDAGWVLSQSNTVALQRVNADASILLSPFIITNEQVLGSWLVTSNDLDDDFIGFVFGYQDNRHFYLFDWKKDNQTNGGWGLSLMGMSVKVMNSSTPLTATNLGQTYNPNTNAVRLLYHNSIPWRFYTNYGFNLEIQPGRFTITVTQETNVLDTIVIHDTTYASGKFGFYNFSQGWVQYAGFTRREFSPRPIISAGDAAVVEGNAGTTTLSFPVTLSLSNCEPTLVDYRLAAGTATAGQDFNGAGTGTLLFEPGETNKLLSISVLGDLVAEANETVLLTLSNAVGGTLLDSLGVGTILNDDTNYLPVCSITPASPLFVSAGVRLTYSFAASDSNAMETITLSAAGLPDGAVMLPGLPHQGLAAGTASTFNWTPRGDQTGDFPVVMSVVDSLGLQTLCPVAITVLPVCDLAVEMTANPAVPAYGGPVTFALAVTNLGISPVFEAFVANTLPAGLGNITFVTSQGSCALAGGVVTCALGGLAIGGGAIITINATAGEKGTLVNSATVSSVAYDPHLENNSASASVTVVNGPPVVSIVNPTEGATFSAPPGVVPILASASDSDGFVQRVDFYSGPTWIAAATSTPFSVAWTNLVPGPYVLTAVALDNDGASATSAPVNIVIVPCDPNLTATPLADQNRCLCDEVEFSTTVTSTAEITYVWKANGVVIPGANSNRLLLNSLKPEQAGVYTVEASTACSSITRSATLALRGAGSQNPVSFTNSAPVTVNGFGAFAPYPSAIHVDCLPASIRHLAVTIDGLGHTFPDDIDMMLVSPGGLALKLMSDTGGNRAQGIADVTLTFTDTATTPLPDATRIESGLYRPTDYGSVDAFTAPAPTAAATNTSFAPFLGTAANGTWSLYVLDDSAGDLGSIARGWTLTVEWADTPPVLSDPLLLADGRFRATLHGLPHMTHLIEGSSDLLTWEQVSLITPAGPAEPVFDLRPTGPPHRFYRAVRCP